MSTEESRPRIESPSALPLGTRLGEFELRSVLGVGGFGIVYLAFDHALEREVAVKEYMPSALAGRTETLHVSVRSQSDAETFALGLRSFVNEARLLARFDHPSLLKVHRFWEANGTAYMAMPVLRGRTLKDVRQVQSQPPDEAWLRHLLDPLLGAIDKLHSEGVFHRDIAPDNILIEADGQPVLLDFGAARRVISDKSQTLTAILKPAYAPIEQYAEAGAVRQGPWTDIYALGATLHFLLLGRPPAPATTRAIHDEASALSVGLLPGCSENFLRIIDWMLAPRPADRPQSVAQLRDALDGRAQPPLRAVPQSSEAWARTVVLAPPLPAAPDGAVDTGDLPTRVVPLPAATHSPTYPPVATAPSTTVSPAYASAAAAMVTTAAAAEQSVPGAAEVASPPSSTAPAAAPKPAARQRPEPFDPPAAGASAGSRLPLGIALGLGGLALAAVVAAWMLWTPGAGPAAGPESAVLAASAPIDSVAARASAAMPAAPATEPVAAPAAELATAAPVRPAASEASTAALAPAPAPSVAESAVASVVVSSPAPQRPRPVTPVRTSAQASAASGAPRVVEAARPEPLPRPPPPAAVPAAVAAPAVAPAEPAQAVAQGPEASCAGRNAFSHFVCMERQCLRSENLSHADCRNWRKAAKRE